MHIGGAGSVEVSEHAGATVHADALAHPKLTIALRLLHLV
jgi:hypothetical protein